VLDVGGAVTSGGCGDEEVGLTYPAADRVGRKTAAQDERDAVPHRLERLLLTLGSVLRGPLGDGERVRVKFEEPRHGLRLEVAPAREQALPKRRRRQRLARPDRVPLGTRRALLGDIAALRLGHDNVACRARSPVTVRSSWSRSRFAALAAAHSEHASSASKVSWSTPQPNSYQSHIDWRARLASASVRSAASSSTLAASVRVAVCFMIPPVCRSPRGTPSLRPLCSLARISYGLPPRTREGSPSNSARIRGKVPPKSAVNGLKHDPASCSRNTTATGGGHAMGRCSVRPGCRLIVSATTVESRSNDRSG